MMMITHVNKKNGLLVQLVEKNPKAKTVILQKQDGTYTSVTESTFKRWYRAVEEVTEEVPILVPEIAPSIPEAESEYPYDESEDKVKEQKRVAEFIQLAISVAAEVGLIVRKPDSIRGRGCVFDYEGKGRVELYVGKKTFKVSMKLLDLPEVVEFDYRYINNYYLNVAMNFSYDGNERETLRNLWKTFKKEEK